MNVKVVFLYNIEHHHTCHDSKSLLSCQNSHHPYRTLRPQKKPERVQYLSRKTELIQSYGTFYIEKSDLNVMSIRIFLNYIFHVLLTIAPVKFQQWGWWQGGFFWLFFPSRIQHHVQKVPPMFQPYIIVTLWPLPSSCGLESKVIIYTILRYLDLETKRCSRHVGGSKLSRISFIRHFHSFLKLG